MRNLISVVILMMVLTACSEETLRRTMNTVTESLNGENSNLSSEEVTRGLKEALEVGTKNAVNLARTDDGFLKNPRLRIPFPEEAEKVKEVALDLGLDSQVQKFEANLNHAAERAVSHATPIFVDAITSMTIADAFAILNGADAAATQYLRKTTEDKLSAAFQPEVEKAIEEVDLTKYWSPLAAGYNSATLLTGGEKINPDLNGYVTEKAMEGLFVLMAEEEENIRKNPSARISETLQKVFGSVDNR